jgi:hypothetical protein
MSVSPEPSTPTSSYSSSRGDVFENLKPIFVGREILCVDSNQKWKKT